MNALKRILMSTIAVAAFSGVGQLAWAVESTMGASDGAGAPKAEIKKCDKHKKHDPKAILERLSEKLNLTADQKEKILPILTEKVNAVKELYREAGDKKMKIIDETHAKVNVLLAPEQQKKYDEIIAEYKAECKKHHDHHDKGEMKY
jgi:Spy/CpxP family protein refolding chaperone